MRFNPDMICHVSLIHNCNPRSPLLDQGKELGTYIQYTHIHILRYQVALHPSKSRVLDLYIVSKRNGNTWDGFYSLSKTMWILLVVELYLNKVE